MGVYACKYQIIRCIILMLVCGCHIFLHLMLPKLIIFSFKVHSVAYKSSDISIYNLWFLAN
jgi:hypothetical protein